MQRKSMHRLNRLVFIGLMSIFLAACGSSSDPLPANLAIQGTVDYLADTEAGVGNENAEAQRVASGIQVCALGHCGITDENGGFSFDMNSGEISNGAMLFQFFGPGWTRDMLVENIPSGPGTVTFRFRLHDNTVFGGIVDSDTNCINDAVCGGSGCKVCSYTLMIDMVVKDYWETGDSGCGNCDVYIKSKTWTDSQGVLHDRAERWEYAYRGGSLMASTDQIDPKALPEDSRGIEYIIYRSANGRYAKYVYITPGSSGGSMGHALHLSVNGQLVYAKFLPFQEAIEMGNNFIGSGTLQSGDSTPPNAQTQSADPPDDKRSIASYEKGNVKTTVYNTQMASFSVGVAVDNKSVVTIYKDCNLCTLFNFMTADSRAKSYLDILQGWKHY